MIYKTVTVTCRNCDEVEISNRVPDTDDVSAFNHCNLCGITGKCDVNVRYTTAEELAETE